jgi:hypothetical protein
MSLFSIIFIKQGYNIIVTKPIFGMWSYDLENMEIIHNY